MNGSAAAVSHRTPPQADRGRVAGPTSPAALVRVSAGRPQCGSRTVAEEVAVALTYNGSTHAVMMASPSDVADFAVGFSLSEGIIRSPDEILSVEVLAHDPAGIEARMWVTDACQSKLAERRRKLAGPVGCGLCGLESIEEATRVPAPIDPGEMVVSAAEIAAAVSALERNQKLNRSTHAAHAAALWQRGRGLIALREDVGRHNALDKLAGAAARMSCDPSRAIVVLTSRVSIDLVQKAARLGAPILVAISAPTGAAIRMAETVGLTLVGVARGEDFEAFSHSERIRGLPAASPGEAQVLHVA